MRVVDVVGNGQSIEGDWSRLVLFFGGTPWDGNQFPDQHVAKRLSRYAPVLYVDPPRSIARVSRRFGLPSPVSPLQCLGPRLARLTPIAPPWPARPGVRAVTYPIMRQITRAAVRRLGGDVDAIVVASLSPLLSTCGARLRVLYGTDDFAAGADLMDAGGRWLHRRERAQLAEADVVVAVSDELATKWRAMGVEVEVVANGCDVDLFRGARDATPAGDVDLPSPVVGFVGHLSERIDVSLLEAVAARGTSLLLVGPRQATFAVERLDGLLRRPNVRWVGAKAFEDLPSYLRTMDVGIVPYADSAFNRASFPLKTLEYLAAGLPTVATDLPAIRWLGGDVIDVASGPRAFADAVDAAIERGNDPEAIARRQLIAARNSWDDRALEFARQLGRGPS